MTGHGGAAGWFRRGRFLRRGLLSAVLVTMAVPACGEAPVGLETLEAGGVKIRVRIEKGWRVQRPRGGRSGATAPIRMEFTPTRRPQHGGILPLDGAQISLSWWPGREVAELRRDDSLSDEDEPVAQGQVRCRTGCPEPLALAIRKWRPGPTRDAYVGTVSYIVVPGGTVKIGLLHWEKSRLPEPVRRYFEEVLCSASAAAWGAAGR